VLRRRQGFETVATVVLGEDRPAAAWPSLAVLKRFLFTVVVASGAPCAV